MTTTRHWLSERRELVMVALLAIMSAVLIIGSRTMTVLGEESPGPQMFPLVVGIFLAVMSLALAISVILRPQDDASPHAPDRANFSSEMLHDIGHMDAADDTVRRAGDTEVLAGRRSLLLVLGALVLFIPVLQVAGWVLSAAALYWVIARALGSQRPGFDVFVALFISSSIQLIFGGLLGLNLPAGLIGAL